MSRLISAKTTVPGTAGARKVFWRSVVAVLVCAAVMPAHARRLRFLRRGIAIQGCELTMFMPAGAEPAAVPPPTVFSYRVTSPDGAGRIEERYDFLELWRMEQRIGVWRDPSGNRLELARVMGPAPPRPAPPGHGFRADFDRWWRDVAHAPPPDLDFPSDSQRQWVVDYGGRSGARGRQMARPPMALREVSVYEWEDHPLKLAVLFRLNTAAAGQSRAGAGTFAMFAEAAEGNDPLELRREMAERWLPSIGLTPGAAASVRRPEPSADANTPESRELLESRRRALETIRHLPGWLHVETPHYIILTEDTRARTLIARLERELEIMRRGYLTLIPPPRALSEIGILRIFAGAADYAAYVGAGNAWTTGIWMPDRREMVIRRPAGGDREALDRLMRTVRHEALHQYLFYAFDRIVPCAWYNEGHAVFAEQLEPAGNRIAIVPDGAMENRMIALTQNRRIDLAPLLRMEYAEFYDPDESRRRDNYALAWGLIHYLRLEAPREGGETAAVLDRYAVELWRLRDGPRATAEAWRTVDLDAAARDLARFWSSPARRATARRRRILD